MKWLRIIPALLLAGTVAIACDDDDDPAVTSGPEVTGEFQATSAVFTDNAEPTTRFNVVEEGGTLDMAFTNQGQFTSVLELPGRTAVQRSGTFTVEGSDLRLTENGVTRSAPFTVTQGGLTITDANDRFDFEGAGTTRSATLEAEFARQ